MKILDTVPGFATVREFVSKGRAIFLKLYLPHKFQKEPLQLLKSHITGIVATKRTLKQGKTFN